MDEPLLSILVPTRAARAPFHPWLAWNIGKQTGLDWDRVEIIIAAPDGEHIDLDRFERAVARPARVRRIHYRPETSTVGFIRNGLVMRARGEFFAWFDDDDWHAPDRLETQLSARPLFWNGIPGLTYLDLWTLERVEVYPYRKRVVPITVLARKAAVRGVYFGNQRHGSDTAWGTVLEARHPIVPVKRSGPASLPYFLPLRHGQNMSPQLAGLKSPHPDRLWIDDWRRSPLWNGTDQELAALRQRLVAVSQARE